MRAHVFSSGDASAFPTGREDSPGAQSQSGQQATAGVSFPSNSNATGQEAGSQTRSSGEQNDSNTGRDTSTGNLRKNSGGNTSSGGGISNSQSGDYSLDTLPDGILSGNNNSQTAGAMTAAERAAVLSKNK